MSRYIPLEDELDVTMVAVGLRKCLNSAEFQNHPEKKARIERLLASVNRTSQRRGGSSRMVAALARNQSGRCYRLISVDGDPRRTAGYAVIGPDGDEPLPDALAQVGRLMGAVIPRAAPVEHLQAAGFDVFQATGAA